MDFYRTDPAQATEVSRAAQDQWFELMDEQRAIESIEQDEYDLEAFCRGAA